MAIAIAATSIAERATAWMPEPERAWALLAQINASSGRTRPLDLAVAMVDGGGAVTATGRLRAIPGDGARLELTLADGVAEVHERTATDYRVMRGGNRVDRAPQLVPPLDVLQAGTANAVVEALRRLGADPARVDLGMSGRHDCWVIGGRDPGDFDANGRPSVWVDQESQQPVRIDDANGTQWRMSDISAKDGVRFPSQIDVRVPGWPLQRIQVATPAPTAARPPAAASAIPAP